MTLEFGDTTFIINYLSGAQQDFYIIVINIDFLSKKGMTD